MDAGKTIKYKMDIVYIPKVPLNLPFFQHLYNLITLQVFRKVSLKICIEKKTN